jgi:hypothetical protein
MRVPEIEDLRAALARAFAASDAQRRRIEADLHDGVQQDLVAISVALQLARELGESDPPTADALLAETGLQVREALDRVRSLAQAIYPPSLPSHGLAEALRWLADGRVELLGLRRYPLELEEAVYFSCVELLQQGATLQLRDDHGVLRLQLVAGAPDESALTRVRDRIAALGGRVVYDEPSPR